MRHPFHHHPPTSMAAQSLCSLHASSLSTLLALLLLPSLAFCLLVPASPLILPYHNGPLLAGDQPIKLFVTFYGDFALPDRSTILTFLSSFTSTHSTVRTSLVHSVIASMAASLSPPTVSKWWSLTRGYADSKGLHVSQNVLLMAHRIDNYSRGKFLNSSDILALVQSSLQIFPVDAMSIYVVLTAADVFVEGFCMHSCGGHSYTQPSDSVAGNMLPYAWVGNSKSQCPGFCAWPFARPEYGPPTPPLKAPNELGVDGMIITLAKVLAGAATDPFGNAYFQGDASNALEAGGACTGTFGSGAYPGYPGDLLEDSETGASYNVEGKDGKKFLLPWIWNPATLSCAGQP